jgi:hypothetical protein
MSSKKFFSTLNITSGSSLIATGSQHTIGSIIVSGGNIGVGKNPTSTFDVNGVANFTGLVVSNNVNSGLTGLSVTNNNTNSSAYANFALNCGAATSLNFFLNSGARTSDGPINSATMRNDGGSIRLQSVTNSKGLCVNTNGNVRCGDATNTGSDYPLYVAGFGWTGSLPAYAAYYGFYGWENKVAASYNCSLYTSDWIISGAGLASFSDQRIKKNIIDIDDVSALNTLRQIQPKRYNYIDEFRRGSEPVWGFIAQQVESVLPYATGKIKEFIPNIFDKVTVSIHSDGSTLLTTQVKENIDLDMTDNATMKIKLYTEEAEKIVTIKSVVSQKSFTIEEQLDLNEYFAFGQEIKDFTSLDKNAIYTISVAALQEVDKELQDTKSELAIANATIMSQQAEIDAIKAHLGL